MPLQLFPTVTDAIFYSSVKEIFSALTCIIYNPLNICILGDA